MTRSGEINNYVCAYCLALDISGTPSVLFTDLCLLCVPTCHTGLLTCLDKVQADFQLMVGFVDVKANFDSSVSVL